MASELSQIIVSVRSLQQALKQWSEEESGQVLSPGAVDGRWGPRTLDSYLTFMSWYPPERRHTIEAPRGSTQVGIPTYAYRDLLPYATRYQQGQGSSSHHVVPAGPPMYEPTEVIDDPIPQGPRPPQSYPLPIPQQPPPGGSTETQSPSIPLPNRSPNPQPQQPPQQPQQPQLPPLQAGFGPGSIPVLEARDDGPAWGPILLGLLGVGVVGGLVWYAARGR